MRKYTYYKVYFLEKHGKSEILREFLLEKLRTLCGILLGLEKTFFFILSIIIFCFRTIFKPNEFVFKINYKYIPIFLLIYSMS